MVLALDERTDGVFDTDTRFAVALDPGDLMAAPDPAPARRPVDNLPLGRRGSGLEALAGIRVLDLTTSIAGPYAGMLLGDLGADVVKVERPGQGDDARSWGPPFLDEQSLWFLSVNRNKRSISIDQARTRGRQLLEELIGRADVLLVNQPLATLRKAKLDPETVRALNPRIIHVGISGFGASGRRSDWVCYDLIAEGYSGVMDLTGAADGEAQKVGAPAADMLAGMDAAFATLAALIERQRTGQGKTIEVALTDSMIRFLTCRIVPFLGSGEVPRRSGGKDSVIAIYQAFETADLPMTLGLGTDAIWRRFWEAVGQPTAADQSTMSTNADRRAHRAEIVAAIQTILRTRPRAIWLDLFAAARVPAGPISRVDEVVTDGDFLDRGLFYAIEQADGRRIPQVGLGVAFDGEREVARHAPPALGADGDAVLAAWLAYAPDAISALRAEGAIGGDER